MPILKNDGGGPGTVAILPRGDMTDPFSIVSMGNIQMFATPLLGGP